MQCKDDSEEPFPCCGGYVPPEKRSAYRGSTQNAMTTMITATVFHIVVPLTYGFL